MAAEPELAFAMRYRVETSPEFRRWWATLDRDLRKRLLARIGLLETYGPAARPYADTLKGSVVKNLKELRAPYRGRPYRLLYAFDPRRVAVLLIGGDKGGDPNRYDRAIPRAEEIHAAHLARIEGEES